MDREEVGRGEEARGTFHPVKDIGEEGGGGALAVRPRHEDVVVSLGEGEGREEGLYAFETEGHDGGF